MNISLYGDDDNFGDDEPLQVSIERHGAIMKGAGFNILGPAVLIPEGPAYPGSYQVWWPAEYDSEETSGVIGWVFIDTDGVAFYKDALPTAEAMIP